MKSQYLFSHQLVIHHNASVQIVLLMRIYHEHYVNKRWMPYNGGMRTLKANVQQNILLARGGTFTATPNYISSSMNRMRILAELEEKGQFLQHTIQGNDEPRVHCLLHEYASDRPETSYDFGYKYGVTTLLGTPLHKMPVIEAVSQDMANSCGIGMWSIGINAVWYRGMNDYIGMHTDNNQNNNNSMISS